MRSHGDRHREAYTAIHRGVVVLAIAAALLGQRSPAHAGGLCGNRTEEGADLAIDVKHMSLSTCRLERSLVCCGTSARPIPPLLPGEPPAVTEDTGVVPSVGEDGAVAEPLWDLCEGCGAGVGIGNLLAFWTLCALGLWAMPRNRPHR